MRLRAFRSDGELAADQAERVGARAGTLRIDRPADIARGEQVEITINGRPLAAFQGETVAAALIASGHRAFRESTRRGEPRGLLCGIGLCYECLLIIDGAPGRRACMTEVRSGMRLQTQTGPGLPAGLNWSDGEGYGDDDRK